MPKGSDNRRGTRKYKCLPTYALNASEPCQSPYLIANSARRTPYKSRQPRQQCPKSSQPGTHIPLNDVLTALGDPTATPEAIETQAVALRERLNIAVSQAIEVVVNWGRVLQRGLWMKQTTEAPITPLGDMLRFAERFPKSRAPRPVSWSTPFPAAPDPPNWICNMPGAYQISPPASSQSSPVISYSSHSLVRNIPLSLPLLDTSFQDLA